MARPKKIKESTETTKTTTQKNKPVEERVNEVLDETTQPTEKKPIGTLFNTINYNNVADLDRFIQNLTPDQSLYCLVQAARAAHQRNAYGIEESELISKAIRVLTTPPTEQKQEVPEPEIHKA